MADHFVRHIVRSGDYVRTEFECRAPEGANCREVCKTCMDAGEERCMCGYYDREPVLVPSPCNYLGWFEDAPEEMYDGTEQPVRGPDWQPITLSWQGDYFVWEYSEPRTPPP
jgi:hypothetical protein